MRTFFLLPLAFALAHGGAVAAPQAAYEPSASEIDEIKGMYRLDNGATLKVSDSGWHLTARIGKRFVTEMIPVAEYSYVSRDRRMTLQFKGRPFVDAVVLTYPADLRFTKPQ
ncbi:MAG: hypothetical protein JWQ01_3160 [Massilia sp.]|nr:hypothetical protein [Massilia sp.]